MFVCPVQLLISLYKSLQQSIHHYFFVQNVRIALHFVVLFLNSNKIPSKGAMQMSLIKELGHHTVVKEKHDLIKKLYKSDQRPWIIGYSGGKDSTTVVQLVMNAIKELPKEERKKKIYIISSDTLVENPLIIDYANNNMNLIHETAQNEDLPISTHWIYPKIEESFWVLTIGKGYPTPRQKFRWCTDRLKINPANQFIKDRIDMHGEVIVLLGVRRSESSSRAQSMDRHKVDGKDFHRHTTFPNAFVFTPISDFTLDDVWYYLQREDNPWGYDNAKLLALYQSSQDSSECPMQLDKDAPSCGNSRFGCWACTVVKEDKSLTGFIKSGNKELKPLLDFRNKLLSMRENPDYRMDRRMNGSIYYVQTAEGKKRGLGPFNMKARKMILEDLLKTQVAYNRANRSKPYFELITRKELQLIRNLWIENGDWEDSLPKIYEKIIGERFTQTYSERPLLNDQELELLNQLCEEEDVSVELVKKLVHIENTYHGLKTRRDIFNKMHKVLNEDWLHEELTVYEREEFYNASEVD